MVKHDNQSCYLRWFKYDRGELYWKENPTVWQTLTNKKVGSVGSKGYINVCFNGQTKKAHRIIWIMHYGEIPKGLTIDHINRNNQDNRIENLRLATADMQSHNTKAKGYSFLRGKYRAYIRINKVLKSLGTYGTECGARMRYLFAKRAHYDTQEIKYAY